MRKNLQPYGRSEQPQDQFITELGALLAKQANNRQPTHQRQAVANLAEYVRVARSHHNLTRSALAQQIGKSEVEIYALEQGLLPYAQLDLRLLCTIAAALGEEVETLILLLGQPALAHSLREESTHKHGDKQRFSLRHRTFPKQIDNWLRTLLGINLLSNQWRNLVDFWQKGRLLSCIRENYHLTTSLNANFNLGLKISAVLLVCLLLFGVSTYSLSTFFGAKSSEKAYTTLPYSNNGHVERSANLSPITSTAAVTPVMTIAVAQRRAGQVVVVPVDPANDQQMATISLLLLPTPNESQRCDWRTNGRFTICRI